MLKKFNEICESIENEFNNARKDIVGKILDAIESEYIAEYSGTNEKYVQNWHDYIRMMTKNILEYWSQIIDDEFIINYNKLKMIFDIIHQTEPESFSTQQRYDKFCNIIRTVLRENNIHIKLINS